MYEELDSKNIKVKHHIHERNTTIYKIIRDHEHTSKSYDGWHAEKPITQGIINIGTGRKKHFGVIWHPRLADKDALLKKHVYRAMDHCNNDASQLPKLIDVCIEPCQNKHGGRDAQSKCRTCPKYTPTFTVLTEKVAVDLFTKFIHSLVVYKFAQDYVSGADTYYVESFNNTMLIYLDKRIHYKNTMYELRANLSIMDWNEHVDRPFTSIKKSSRPQHPRRHQGKKAYKRKTYSYVDHIWSVMLEYLSNNDIPEIEESNIESSCSEDESDSE